MKKQNITALLVLAFAVIAAPIYSQDEQQQTEKNSQLPVVPTGSEEAAAKGTPRAADEQVQTVLIDSFDTAELWTTSIPLDYGTSRVLYRAGGPKELISDEGKEQYVLGVKTLFIRRNFGGMSIDRPYPVQLFSIVRNFSFWVAGRNRRHTLSLKIRDMLNNYMNIPAGEMVWQGWKKLVVPTTDPIIQYDYRINRRGLDFLGFQINFEAEDIIITEPYYIYFDYLTATIDIPSQQLQDDMKDNW